MGPGTRRRRAGLLAAALAAVVVLAGCGPVTFGGGDKVSSRSAAGAGLGAPATSSTAAPHPTTTRPAGAKASSGAKRSGAGKASSGQRPTATTRPAPPPRLTMGDRGAAVLALQRRLKALGYEVAEADGEFGAETHHAVVAFQKVNRLDRDGVAGPKTLKALERPRRPSPRSRGGGLRIEADLTLQVVYVVVDGAIQQILDASSASGGQYVVDGDVRIAHTPEGSFHVERKIDGWRESDLGLLYRPAYFVGGYALHGAPSVPPFPASHGCIRITTTAMDRLFGRLALGTPVLVYRS